MDLGNHSWDHPCLEQCTEEDRRAQVMRAHEWLKDKIGTVPTLFSYPNGVFCTVVISS